MGDDDLAFITRVDIIDKDGRTQYGWPFTRISFSLQDDGRTLKVFVEEVA